MPKNLGKLACLGLLVSLVTLSACRSDEFGRAYATERRAALLAKSGGRFTPGRLVGVPWSPVRDPPQATVANPPVPAGAAEFRGEGVVDYSPLESASRGFALLVDRGEGQSADSVLRRFEQAWEAGQSDPAFLNDYAAALLERGLPRDLILGGEYAARALESAELDDPHGDLAQAARFNWALAIKRLALHGQATKAWQAVLDHETDSRWRAEAEAHLEDLAQWPVARWPQVRQEVRAAAAQGDLETVSRLLPDFRTAIRLLAEDEEIKTWAETVETDPIRAAEAVTVARTIGAALAPTDRFLADIVAGIDGVKGDVKKTGELAGAVRGFYGGLGAYQRTHSAEAGPVLADSGNRLTSLKNPLAYRAEFQSLVAANGVGLGEMLKLADDLEDRIPHRYTLLVSQVVYLRGWKRSRAGYHEASLADLEVSVELTGKLGEDLAASYGSQWSTALSFAADPRVIAAERGWAERGRGVVAPYHRYFLCYAWIARALYFGPQASAIGAAALKEASGLLPDVRQAVFAAQTETELFRLALHEGRSADLSARWAEVQNTIKVIEDERKRNEAIAMLDWAVARRPRSSTLAKQRALLSALSRFSKSSAVVDGDVNGVEANGSFVYHQLSLLGDLAQLSQKDGDQRAAGRYSRKALDLVEERFRQERPRGRGYGVAAEVRPLLATWLSSELLQERPLDSLYDGVEWAFHLAAPGDSPRIPGSKIGGGLSPGTVLVQLVPVGEKLIAYRFTSGSAEPQAEVLAVPRLGSLVDCLDPRQRALSCRPWPEVARQLAEQAVEPWICPLRVHTRLVLVAGPLARVPFAALPLRCPGEPEQVLVARHVISFSASATAHFESLERARVLSSAGEPRRVLAVGVSRPKSAPTPLDHAPDEARAVASQYQESELLLDAAATKEAVIAALDAVDVLHFATHGEVDRAKLSASFLSLAKGYLTMDDLGNRLLSRPRLAVLAACDTGGAVVGVEGLVGISRAFLDLGVPAVVATLGRVVDQAAAEMMRTFHERYLATGDAARALSEAQLEAVAKGAQKGEENQKEVPEWAKWVVVGV